jgi:serine/threonine-protein kinase HipA
VSIKIVNVFLNSFDEKIKVGRLALKNKIIYFEYEKEFLSKGIELSPYKLPLKSGVHLCEDTIFEGLFGLFADSLPDGWGRLLLDRYFLKQGLAYSDITPLDRLSYIGSYGIGALSYEPIIENIELENREINLDFLARSSLEILKGNTQELLDTLLAMGGSSAGARPKAMIQINSKNDIIHGSQKLHDGFEHYLVKFPSSVDTQDIGKLEYAYSLMAKDANIYMPQTKLLHGKKNSYFSIKRFDRVEDKRVHIHSVAGIAHSDFRLPSLDYDDLLALTLHLTKDKEQQKKMFRIAVFNLLTHNRDDHAKNFSFLLDKNHNWRLAPAYDLTFSFGPGGEHSTTYLGEGKSPNVEQLKKLALKHDIKNYMHIIDEVENVVSNFKYYTKRVGIDNKISNDIYKYLIKIRR